MKEKNHSFSTAQLTLRNVVDLCKGQTAMIVGKGPTDYDYSDLALFPGPCLFINDTVSLAHFHQGLKFFFALDRCQRFWLDKLGGSIPVLAKNHKMIDGPVDPILGGLKKYLLYRVKQEDRDQLFDLSRQELAKSNYLYTHSGTIHPTIHFAWLLGVTKIQFVGCEGFNDTQRLRKRGDRLTGYDPRLTIGSEAKPWWNYSLIRTEQDRICRRLELETSYLGSPALQSNNSHETSEALIPAMAHFIWLEGSLPEEINRNIEAFRSLHPDWKVILWRTLPDDLPQDIQRGCAKAPTHQIVADLIRFWILKRHGGIVIGADILPVRSFSKLRYCDHFLVRERIANNVSHVVFGASPESEFPTLALERVRSGLQNISETINPEFFRSIMLTKLTRSHPERYHVLPFHYFNVFDSKEQATEALKNEQANPGHINSIYASLFIDSIPPFGINTKPRELVFSRIQD